MISPRQVNPRTFETASAPMYEPESVGRCRCETDADDIEPGHEPWCPYKDLRFTVDPFGTFGRKLASLPQFSARGIRTLRRPPPWLHP